MEPPDSEPVLPLPAVFDGRRRATSVQPLSLFAPAGTSKRKTQC
jgi:hypothetical protein